MRPQPSVECEQIIAFLRKEAEHARSVANDYKVKRVDGEARVWSKVAEGFGNIANRLERGEHLGAAGEMRLPLYECSACGSITIAPPEEIQLCACGNEFYPVSKSVPRGVRIMDAGLHQVRT